MYLIVHTNITLLLAALALHADFGTMKLERLLRNIGGQSSPALLLNAMGSPMQWLDCLHFYWYVVAINRWSD